MSQIDRRSLLWVVATLLGMAFGGFMFHLPGTFGDSAGWELTALIFGGLIGAVSGLVVGLMQWAALGLRRREGNRLLVWMGVGIGFTHALFDGGPASLGLVVLAAVAAVGFTLAYIATIGDRDPRRVLAVGVGWVISLVLSNTTSAWLGLPWEETPIGWSTHHLIEGAVIGLVWGSVTAVAGVARRVATTAVDTEIAIAA